MGFFLLYYCCTVNVMVIKVLFLLQSYKVSDVRKADQKVVDAQLLSAIRKHADRYLLFKNNVNVYLNYGVLFRKVLLAYLSAMFGLRSSQFPHRLQF